MNTLDVNIVELKEQAEELMRLGNSKEIAEGKGMMTVLDELENLLPKPNTLQSKYPQMQKVVLEIIVNDDDEAKTIAHNMENSFIAQEGLYTMSCGSIEPITEMELDSFESEIIDLLTELEEY